MRRTCIGCKYYDQCGDKKRVEPCEGREFSEQYKDFADRVVKAFDNGEDDILELLRLAHRSWYQAVIREIRDAYEQM